MENENHRLRSMLPLFILIILPLSFLFYRMVINNLTTLNKIFIKSDYFNVLIILGILLFLLISKYRKFAYYIIFALCIIEIGLSLVSFSKTDGINDGWQFRHQKWPLIFANAINSPDEWVAAKGGAYLFSGLYLKDKVLHRYGGEAIPFVEYKWFGFPQEIQILKKKLEITPKQKNILLTKELVKFNVKETSKEAIFVFDGSWRKSTDIYVLHDGETTSYYVPSSVVKELGINK